MIQAILLFLLVQFNSSIGLHREAPNVAPNTYWVYSDGYLAGDDLTRFTGLPLTKWWVLRGEVVPEAVFTYGSTVTELGGGVRTEEPDCTIIFADWQEYADRLLLATINAQNAGDIVRATEILAIADSMWSGIGLRDKVYIVDGKYETYKLALYYYATGRADVRRVLKKLQERDPSSNRYGGMYTEYGDNLLPFDFTDVNTETSAITLLALRRW